MIARPEPAQLLAAAAQTDPLAPETAWVQALQPKQGDAPTGLCTANGSDVVQRFSIHRNNVLSASVQALADTFPVCLALVGADFFHAMAWAFADSQRPRSRLMAFYGEGFAEFVGAFPPAVLLPYLSDMAELEMARVRAYHAADAPSLPLGSLEAAMQMPQSLPDLCLRLHPSLALLDWEYAVLSLWQAHQHEPLQRDAMLANTEVHKHEGAAVFRKHDSVVCQALSLVDLAFLHYLQIGQPLGQATELASAAAQTHAPPHSVATGQTDPDIGGCLSLLVQHGLITELAPHPTPEIFHE